MKPGNPATPLCHHRPVALVSAVQFAAAARVLADAARRLGLRAPGFRSPPRLVGADRTLRRRGDGSVVSVRLRGRRWVPVLADMVEGVIVANQLRGPTADRAREELWEAVAGELGQVDPASAKRSLPARVA